MAAQTVRGRELPVCCPCGGGLALSEADDGKFDGVIHTEPTCKDFDDRDPIAFVKWLRHMRGDDRP